MLVILSVRDGLAEMVAELLELEVSLNEDVADPDWEPEGDAVLEAVGVGEPDSDPLVLKVGLGLTVTEELGLTLAEGL